MAVLITGVEAGSPAYRAGILTGHTLHTISGNAISDLLDYRFYATERSLALCLSDEQGREYEVQIKKGQYDDLGLDFESYLMDKKHSCKNKCVFCFIDQLPKGLRPSLYFKDDDERLSFLFGNYITLTNLTDSDVERIIKMRISPVNISVHTTDPQLRVAMMANPHAGEVLKHIPKLCDAGIQVNTQLVLCPGINDGAALERSLRDLSDMGENLHSIAVVPVGLTLHRDGLSPLRLFTKEEANAVVDTVLRFGDQCMQQRGRRVAYPADEFFLCAGRTMPENNFYGDFEHLENGVGLWTSFRSEFYDELEYTPAQPVQKNVKIATGKAAYPLLSELAQAAQAHFPGLTAEAVSIPNRMLGPDITVAGLVSAGDILCAMQELPKDYDLLLPACMLNGEGVFLDDQTPDELSQQLGVKINIVPIDGAELLGHLISQ